MPRGASGSFRPLEEIAEELRTVPEFGDLATAFEATPASLRVLYESCRGMFGIRVIFPRTDDRLKRSTLLDKKWGFSSLCE